MIAKHRSAVLVGDYALIPLGINSKDGYAIVDAIDRWVDKFPWIRHSQGYAASSSKGKVILLHRIIMDAKGKITVDHIDGNRLHNRRSNLRLCSLVQNNYNKPPQSRNKCGYKGVEKVDNSPSWRSVIRFEGKRYHLGCFASPQEAALAYNEKAKELFGDYAYLNEAVL
jgi:hypothetical protein